MRVSTGMMQRLAVAAMLERQSVLSDSQLQIASGKRILAPSDDPAGSTRILLLNQKLAINDQYQANTGSALIRLNAEEQALAAAGESLQRVRELAVRGLNGTMGPDNREAIAKEVRQRLDELVDIANSKDGSGDYIFGGYQVKTPPFEDTGTGVFNYLGDQGQRAVQISPTRQIAVNDSGENIFVNLDYSGGGKQDIFRTLFDFENALTQNLRADFVSETMPYTSALEVGQQGNGIDPSSVLAAGDLTIATGDNPPVAIGASADNSAGFGNVGRTAQSAYSKALAINNANVPDLSVEADTTVLLNFVEIQNTDSTYTLAINGVSIYASTGANIDGPKMMAAINSKSAESGVTAVFDSVNSQIKLKASDGRNITVSQLIGNTPTNIGQGLTSTVNNQNNIRNDALDMTNSLVGASITNTFVGTIRLTSPTAISLSGANEATIGYGDEAYMPFRGNILEDIDTALDNLFSVRAQIGARMNVLESQQQINEQFGIQLESSVAEIRDLDYAEAIGRMNLQLVGLQASQQAFQKIQNLSLFNYL